MGRKKIGESFIDARLITEADLQAALAEHKRTGQRLGAVLVRMNLATEQQIAKALADQYGYPFVSLADMPPEQAAIKLIPKALAHKYGCVGIRLQNKVLTVAISDPVMVSLARDLEFATGHRIELVVATQSEIFNVISTGQAVRPQQRPGPRAPGQMPKADPKPTLPRLDDGTGEGAGPADRGDIAPIIELADRIVKSAIANRISDVHIEPRDRNIVVRHRLDGLLKEVETLPLEVRDGLVARLKIMASLDIAEKRLPQDGRLRVPTADGEEVGFRVSTLRTVFGEKVVLRMLDNRKGVPALGTLGMSATALEDLRSFLSHQHGMIVVVGPTGSGKTTTLASALSSIQSGRTNIITVEDPVEYVIAGTNQTQINEKAKLTFASALRAILRQDPDVILVGEIRDQETARIAIQAAQTGHLVLSTLHTEDAPSAVTRLMDMGIEPYMIGSALVGVVAQRLVRKLCEDCRRPQTPAADTLRSLNISEGQAGDLPFYEAVGCPQCNQTGYRGRIGLYEVMPVTDKLRRLISQGGGEEAIRDAALAAGMKTLGDDGIAKVKSGVTTAEELLRVVAEVTELRTLCPFCSGAIGMDFNNCPHCGQRLSSSCVGCHRALQAEWRFCPHCAAAVEAPKVTRRPSEIAA